MNNSTLTPEAARDRAPDVDRAPSRVRLALVVLEGYAYLAFVIAIFAGVVTFLAWGLLNRRPLIGLMAILVGLPVLVTSFRAIRAIFFALSSPDGVAVTPQSGGGLLTVVEDIRRCIRAPCVHQVLITNRFNASAVQVPRAGLFWPRNTLLLGYPMLATMSPEQIRAVIAHELGHMTHVHGRLSSWVHRTRVSWLRLMRDLGARGATPAPVHFLFRWYVPRLDAEAAAVSRGQERLADRLAAAVAGPDTTAQALVAIEIGGYVFDRMFWPGIFNRVEHDPEPPHPYTEMGPEIWTTVAIRPELLTELLVPDSASGDSHPSLKERLAVLGRAPQLPGPVAETAAERFLGNDRHRIAAALDQKWESMHARRWRQQHDEMRGARERLALLEAIDAPTPEQLFERAALLEQSSFVRGVRLQADHHGPAKAGHHVPVESGPEREGHEDQALELYKSANAAGHAAAGFAAGRMLLDRDDNAGLTMIEAAMDAQPSLVGEGCAAVIAFLEQHGLEADAQRFRVRRTRHATRAKLAASEREKLTVVDQFARCSDARVDVLSVARRLAREPIVSRAFLVSKELRHSTGQQTVLALLANGSRDDLGGTLKREGLLPEHVAIVRLGRHDRQLLTALEQTPGALLYERAGFY